MCSSFSYINATWIAGLLALGILLALPSMADEPITPEGVSELVSQLNAATRGEREAAERKLIALGPAVLPLLPESFTDPATRAALSRIRERLSKQQATSRATQPTRVSIAGTGPLDEVAASWLDDDEFPRLSLAPRQRDRHVALTERNVPYWRAIDRLAEAAELWPDEWTRASGLTFRERTANDEKVRLAYPGAFRVAGGPVQVKSLPGAGSERLYRLPLAIRAEPGLRPLFFMHQASSGVLLGENGSPLKPFTPGAAYELQVGERGGVARLRLDFKGPPVEGPFTFKGEFVATVASGEVPFSFDLSRDAFQRTEKTQGGVTVRLRDVEWKTNGHIEVVVAVVYADGASAFESYRTWIYHNDAALIVERDDGDVLRIEHEPAFETVAQSPGALLLRYQFKNVPTEAEEIRFEYRAPTEVIEVPVEVELKGLTVEKRSE